MVVLLYLLIGLYKTSSEVRLIFLYHHTACFRDDNKDIGEPSCGTCYLTGGPLYINSLMHNRSNSSAVTMEFVSYITPWIFTPWVGLQQWWGPSWDCPDSKVHGANMGLIWGRQDPGGPHVGPMNFAIWVIIAVNCLRPQHFKRN